MNEHKTEFDVIRLIAIFLVIFNHTGTYGFTYFVTYFDWSEMTPISSSYWLYMIPSIICKAAVPLFFMISGALLLGKDESLRHILTKRVAKYAVILLSVSVLYYLRSVMSAHDSFSLSGFIKLFCTGKVSEHLWFLYCYIAFLMFLPLLRRLKELILRENLKYLILLSVFVNGFVPIFLFLFEAEIPSKLHGFICHSFSYIFLFPLTGYGCSKYRPKRRDRLILVLLSLVSFVPVMILTFVNMKYKGFGVTADEGVLIRYWDCFAEIRAIAIFAVISFVISRATVSNDLKDLLNEGGKCVFGVYLIEPVIQYSSVFYVLLIKAGEILPVFAGVLIHTLLVFIVTVSIVFVSRKLIKSIHRDGVGNR